MQGFRIANLIMQSAYLIGHALFIVILYRKRQPTPVWRWFFLAAIAMWLWVSGRFMESIVYLFFPANNDAYVFAANFQYIGNTTAVVSYVIWIFHLSGHDRLASSFPLKAFLFSCPVVICTLVFTNQWHHLFYTKLVMGERVGHGPLFAPCLIWSYLILLSGYITSVQHVLRTGRDIVKKLFMFSMFPVVPAIGVLVRSLSGVDRVDYTPIIMAIAMFFLYKIIFGYHYVNIISASVREIIEQSTHPTCFFSPDKAAPTYMNRIARERYADVCSGMRSRIGNGKSVFVEEYDGEHWKIDVTPFPEGGAILAAGSNVSDIVREQQALSRQIAELESLRRTLEESNRNIDAYFESLCNTERLRDKQAMISETYAVIRQTLERVNENLLSAKGRPGEAEDALRENLALTRQCIAAIRQAVARLKEV